MNRIMTVVEKVRLKVVFIVGSTSNLKPKTAADH
jgi:hypothetical protein